jgi:Uma2 family endonuclease
MILDRLLNRAVGDLAVVLVQGPIILGDRSMPQPDLALLKPRADSYTRSHPTAADVLLVVEVADTTLSFDLGTKIPLYARSGIPEAWVVDLPERVVRVFRDPGAGGYRTSLTVTGDSSINLPSLPTLSVALPDFFVA